MFSVILTTFTTTLSTTSPRGVPARSTCSFASRKLKKIWSKDYFDFVIRNLKDHNRHFADFGKIPAEKKLHIYSNSQRLLIFYLIKQYVHILTSQYFSLKFLRLLFTQVSQQSERGLVNVFSGPRYKFW